MPPQDEPDTDPELFRVHPDADTAERCSFCGHDKKTYQDGITFTLKQLRKWLAGHMTASEAIHVTAKFSTALRRG
jgi:hypothetical protein